MSEFTIKQVTTKENGGKKVMYHVLENGEFIPWRLKLPMDDIEGSPNPCPKKWLAVAAIREIKNSRKPVLVEEVLLDEEGRRLDKKHNRAIGKDTALAVIAGIICIALAVWIVG